MRGSCPHPEMSLPFCSLKITTLGEGMTVQSQKKCGIEKDTVQSLGEDSQTAKSSKDSKYHPTQFSPLHRSGN